MGVIVWNADLTFTYIFSCDITLSVINSIKTKLNKFSKKKDAWALEVIILIHMISQQFFTAILHMFLL